MDSDERRSKDFCATMKDSRRVSLVLYCEAKRMQKAKKMVSCCDTVFRIVLPFGILVPKEVPLPDTRIHSTF